MLKIDLCITELNYIYINIENSYFKLQQYFTILLFLLYFWSQTWCWNGSI